MTSAIALGKSMEEQDDVVTWWRCAYYQYRDSSMRWDHADGDEARDLAVTTLLNTVSEFVEGRWNLGTLKYRMDEASQASTFIFPERSVSATLQDLAMSVPLEVLEPALRRAASLPDSPGEAKGALMDLEELMEREVSRGHLHRSQAQGHRWTELLATLWHIQDPLTWPLVSMIGMRCLRHRGELGTEDDYAEYASIMQRLSSSIGASMMETEHLLASLEEGDLHVPDAEECHQSYLKRAEDSAASGLTEESLELFERALALRPRTPMALMRKAELYEGKGLLMASIGEMETLVELEPVDLTAHRKLLSLYKAQGMIREHNIEVRRFKALKESRK